MRKALFAIVLAGCAGQVDDIGNNTTPDAKGPNPDAPVSSVTCPLPGSTADTGTLSALKAQKCNVSGTMGTRKWYRLSASLPGGATDIVQLELWDGRGAFTGGTVHTGTFQLSGAELDYATCGVCVRAVGDKGTTGAKTYFATGGTVEVTAVGTTLSAKITNITLAEVDAQNAKVASGCTANVAAATVSGTVQDLTNVGGGGGGGGGGGTGGGTCATTVGD